MIVYFNERRGNVLTQRQEVRWYGDDSERSMTGLTKDEVSPKLHKRKKKMT